MLNKVKDTLYDANYTREIAHGWSITVDRKSVETPDKRSRLDKFVDFFVASNEGKKTTSKKSKAVKEKEKTLEQQLKTILQTPDEEYNDEMLGPELRKYILQLEKEYVATIKEYKGHLAPSYREVKPWSYQLSSILWKTYYISSYPSYIDFLWTRWIYNYHAKWDMSRFIYPADDGAMQWVLKRRSTQLKAEISTASQKWITYDSDVDIEFRDVEEIRQKLATREERYFETSLYTTIYKHDEDKLREESKKFEQKISWYWIRAKQASQRMDEGQTSMLPLCVDDLWISRSMVTTSLAGSFPFISNDLIENQWILYGVNLHSWSLVIFDRFASKLPNANSVVLATSGAWKSFATKLEILRYLLLGIETIVIDPENEYKALCEKVWGSYIDISINSQQYINPFDLPPKISDVEYETGDLLRSQIINLIWLISVLIGWVSPEEEALLDKALQATYALKEITTETKNIKHKTPPTMEDLLHVLEWMDGGETMALKLSKYVSWTFGKLFNNKTNIDLDNTLTVFSIRDIEDALKTPAMFNVLDFIWTKVRSEKKKRLLVIDEAWIMMQEEVAAQFLYQLTKRARKYGLGVTTITQDVEDFLDSKYGKPIISNAAIQLLLKQSTASIKTLEKAFGLSSAEKQQLVSSAIWEWLIFAWKQHVAVKILSSPKEKDFITTDI